MVERFEMSDGLGAIYPPMMYAIMALDVLGYKEDHPLRAEAVRQFDALMVDDGERFFFQPCFSVVWDTDPAALGGYSHFRPGELTRYGPLLAQPQGRIHFAGEHTDPWQATMNGALASGLRAGGEVLTRLRPG